MLVNVDLWQESGSSQHRCCLVLLFSKHGSGSAVVVVVAMEIKNNGNEWCDIGDDVAEGEDKQT